METLQSIQLGMRIYPWATEGPYFLVKLPFGENLGVVVMDKEAEPQNLVLKGRLDRETEQGENALFPINCGEELWFDTNQQPEFEARVREGCAELGIDLVLTQNCPNDGQRNKVVRMERENWFYTATSPDIRCQMRQFIGRVEVVPEQ